MKEEITINKGQRKNISRKFYMTGIVIIVVIIAYGFYSNLETKYYTYQDEYLPKKFDGFKIAFLSDFHCQEFGSHEEKLINEIKACNPDIVVFTGDMIDGDHSDLTPVKDLLSGLSGLYPMYAVSGNHEFDIFDKYQELLDYYTEYGVTYLDFDHDIIKRDNAVIGIYGKQFAGNYITKDFLEGPDKGQTEFNILLYHDATAFPITSTLGFNLILSGHTHGGIIRLPLIGGLINNNRSLIAEYDNGIYKSNNSTLISSRGLGDSIIPRFYNRRELICVTLKAIDEENVH